MNSDQKKSLRSKLFRHLDGIVISPTAYALKKTWYNRLLTTKQESRAERIDYKIQGQ